MDDSLKSEGSQKILDVLLWEHEAKDRSYLSGAMRTILGILKSGGAKGAEVAVNLVHAELQWIGLTKGKVSKNPADHLNKPGGYQGP